MLNDERFCDTHGDDLGEDDGEQWLHDSIDYGTDGSQQDVRPLGRVEAKDFNERHGGNFFHLRKETSI